MRDRTTLVLPLVTVALAAKSVVVALAVLDTDRWAALVAVSALPLVALLVSPALLLRGPGRTAYLVGVDVLVTTILLADLLNVRASGRLISLHMVAAAGSFEGLGSSVLAMFRWYDVLIYVDLLMLLAVAGFVRRRRDHTRAAQRRLRPRTVGLVAAASVVAFGAQVLMQTSDPGMRVVALSPLGAHAHEAYDELVDTSLTLSRAERARVDEWFAGNAAYQQVAPEHEDLVGLLAERDVYLLQVESLEQAVVGLEVEGQEVTPVLNGLLEESIRFTDVVQQTRDGNTADAELLVQTSVYPLQAGAAFMRFPENRDYVTLPRLAADRGWTTTVLHGDVATFWNRHEVYPRLGWDDYVSEEDFAATPQIGMGAADSALFDQALLELEELGDDERVLMYLSTMTSHTPWDLPPRLQELDLEVDNHGAGYLQSLRYTDTAFGEFYTELGERGRLDRSAFVIFGDHEGIHKYFPEEAPPLVPDNDLRLPLIVHVPGMDGRRVTTPGGQVDVLPTLAQLMGVPAERYAGSVMGRTLLGPTSGSAVTSDGVVLPGADGARLLRQAYDVADLAVTGDWFAGP